MVAVRRLVIDVLKPHEPPLLEFTERIAAVDSVDGATGSLIELDQEVQNVKLTVEGAELEFDAVESTVEDLGGTVHSVDEVACGDVIVEERPTQQDG
ncbi:MAG: DUF211 domain-containing protein [Halorientalis sp.]